MPSDLLVQLRQLHPLEVSDSKPMPSALLVQLRQLHPLKISDTPTLLQTKKGLKAPYRPTRSGAIQSFQPIKKTVAPQWSTYYFINPAPITILIQRLCFCPCHYLFCFIIASISTNSLPIFRLR